MLIDLLKRSFLLQNAASWALSRVPLFVDHNVAKYVSLRRAFAMTALDGVEGDYLEFGVFTGASFVMSMRAADPLGPTDTRFFGFDSFAGFGPSAAAERHPFYTDAIFSVDRARVEANIRAHARGKSWRIVPGFFHETLAGRTARDLGVERARVILVDCDMREPALLALDFVEPALQPGTIVLLDDNFAYRGDTSRGVAGAFAAFRRARPHLRWRRVADFGIGGTVAILSERAEGPAAAPGDDFW